MDTKSLQDIYGTADEMIEKGYADIKNYEGTSVRIVWGDMPQGYFKLKMKGKELIFNKHELQYILRNV
jgi:hypothetical protein